MTRWSWCDELDSPEIGVCMDNNWWSQHKQEIYEWFQKDGQEVGVMVGPNVIWLSNVNQKPLFLLIWG